MSMVMEGHLKSGVDQMKMIFNLCDRNKEGFICAEDFRKIGQDHFEHVDALIQVMDPLSTGRISFSMFCRGIEVFLLEGNPGHESGSVSSVSSLEAGNSDVNKTEVKEGVGCDEFDGGYPDAVFPVNQPSTSHCTNGYLSSSPNNFELVVNGCSEQDSLDREQPSSFFSTPLNSNSSTSTRVSRSAKGSPPLPRSQGSPTMLWSRESPTLLGKQLHRHKLMLPENSSQGSTPAEQEAEEEVSRLSDQLHELSTKLEELEGEQKDSEGFRARMKKENAQLRDRLEEYEDLLRATEEDNQKILSDSQRMLKSSLAKVHRESETQIMELRSQLESATNTISQLEATQVTLKAQMIAEEEEKLILEKEAVEKDTKQQEIQDELYRTRELLRIEQNKWEAEREQFNLAIQERDLQIRQLHQECEDVQNEQQTKAIAASDMDTEINRLKKALERSRKQNDELQAKFLNAGKQLVAASSSPPSLEMEMESASKDEVVKALEKSEEMNFRLNTYIGGLLTSIIEKYPELLEIPSS